MSKSYTKSLEKFNHPQNMMHQEIFMPKFKHKILKDMIIYLKELHNHSFKIRSNNRKINILEMKSYCNKIFLNKLKIL